MIVDLSGQVFQYLKVRHRTTEQNPAGSYLWSCECLLCNLECFATCTQLKKGKKYACNDCQKLLKQEKRDQKFSLVGQTFGRWFVLGRAGKDKHGFSMYLCECSCNLKSQKEIRGILLKSGNSKSCGCLFAEFNNSELKKEIGRISYNKQISDPLKKEKFYAALTKKKTDEHKKKLSEAAKNRPSTSDATKEKLRQAMLGRNATWAIGNKNAAGKIVSEETKNKISKSLKGRFKGKDSPNWKGGIKSLMDSIRKSVEYIEWRKLVYKRDNYICQQCNSKNGGNIEADHKIALSALVRHYRITSLEEAKNCSIIWDISNGRTLCKACHRLTPNWGIKALKQEVIQ